MMDETVAVPIDLLERAAYHITQLNETIRLMGGVVGKTGTLDDIHEILLAHRLAQQPKS
jgi:hypothetical protein